MAVLEFCQAVSLVEQNIFMLGDTLRGVKENLINQITDMNQDGFGFQGHNKHIILFVYILYCLHHTLIQKSTNL